MARSVRARAGIRAFAAHNPDDPLLWCHLPRLLSATNRVLEPHCVPAPLPGGEMRRMRRSGASRRKRTVRAGPSVALGAGCLFMANDANQLRAQAPLRQRFGPVRGGELATRLGLWRTRRRLRQASDLAGELIAFAASRQLELSIDSASLHQGLLRTARLLEGWRRLLADRPADVVVVGSVWQPPARALLRAAREAGVPSVYVPHCPQRSSAHPIDLAVDYVALRGPGEGEFLAAQGIDRELLNVVGDPSTVDAPPPEIDPSSCAVFAPSSEDPRILRPMIELVQDALGGQVVVGRHPAARAGGAGAFPRCWQVFGGRTQQLLRAGPPVVLQQSSGVALESMHLGIPVVELQFPGQTPTFPLIRAPHVRFASTSGQLRTALAACSAGARDTAHRKALVGWARHWASPTGDAAGQRLVALVEQARTSGPRGAIWDSVRRIAQP